MEDTRKKETGSEFLVESPSFHVQTRCKFSFGGSIFCCFIFQAPSLLSPFCTHLPSSQNHNILIATPSMNSRCQHSHFSSSHKTLLFPYLLQPYKPPPLTTSANNTIISTLQPNHPQSSSSAATLHPLLQLCVPPQYHPPTTTAEHLIFFLLHNREVMFFHFQ